MKFFSNRLSPFWPKFLWNVQVDPGSQSWVISSAHPEIACFHLPCFCIPFSKHCLLQNNFEVSKMPIWWWWGEHALTTWPEGLLGIKAERFGPKLYCRLPAWCWEYIQDPLSGIYIWSFIGYKDEVGSNETELEPPKWKINHIYLSKELCASKEEVFANHQVHSSIVKRTTR